MTSAPNTLKRRPVMPETSIDQAGSLVGYSARRASHSDSRRTRAGATAGRDDDDNNRELIFAQLLVPPECQYSIQSRSKRRVRDHQFEGDEEVFGHALRRCIYAPPPSLHEIHRLFTFVENATAAVLDEVAASAQ